jgi:hypothetical protein
MKKRLIFGVLLLITIVSVYSQQTKVSIDGELKKWHKVTLNFTGDELSENDANNPFLNYRLNVTFKNGDKTYVVPGFYAADGNAAETSSKKGAIWKVRFAPDEIGNWTFEVSFRKGNEIAVNDDVNAGEPVLFDGLKGKFTIEKSDKEGRDFRAKGRLRYVNERYLQFEENNEYFIKGGADSPENFLGYYEFDQTPANHKYEPHAKDWKQGDPTWKNGKGKNIIGALNYLASKGINSVYFLTMNVQGDGKDVWPWIDINERYRFDCSKLDQWEIVFDYMDQLGLMLHIVTQETENELLLDIGETGVQRKLYYRELIARFSHHLAITWNLGEENGPVHWSPKGQNDEDRKAMAKYFKLNDPYKNFVAIHTHAIKEEQNLYLEPLLGYEYLDGISLQIHEPNEIQEITKRWILDSQKSGKDWVVSQDEIGPADTGAKPDADDPEHNGIRAKVLWANLMTGGAGVEWYFGYKYAHNDLNCEDWRSRDILWEQTKYALDFFQTYIPFTEMKSADDLTENLNDYVFAKNGEVFVIYLPEAIETNINLTGAKLVYTVKWYNPKEGGELLNGTVKKVKGGSVVSIGFPPEKQGDWVALLTAKNEISKEITQAKLAVVSLEALSDFAINTSNNTETSYYRDESNGVLAINAADINQRNKFAKATSVFKGENGLYKVSFVTIAENDGESSYEIRVNGTTVYNVTNPETTESFKTTRFDLDKMYLEKNDIIEIASTAVTNGKIPENNETAYSRGRWSTLRLIPDGISIKEQLKDIIPLIEENGFLVVEAEAYHYSSNNGTKRNWVLKSEADEIENHIDSASGNAYLEALPDTRITHDDPLIIGENFFPIAGVGGIISYKVKITNPGKYYIWVKAFSNGTEDNGLHVGLDEKWPESGERMQWCDGKNKWTWSSAQRVEENHCGTPQTIYLNIKQPGVYIVSFSMREDGFEIDKWIMTNNYSFIPE